ncbi:DNA polymerase III subunit gamma/tau [Candidatus Vidania fulgoroideorum]
MNSFYEKYRPTNLKKFIGHKYIIKSIIFFKKKKKYPSSYIFYGKKGTGKTTLSRIFFKILNCYSDCKGCNCCNNFIGLKEIDASKNRKVEDIDEIFKDIFYKPMFVKYKLYVLDEAQMLSNYAFNSLLNTLENLPSYIKVIFITTNINKIPETIKSRCFNFEFKPISENIIYKYLIKISKKENIIYDKKSLVFISKISEGSLRDSLVLLEQCSSIFKKKLSFKKLKKYFNIISNSKASKIVNSLLMNNFKILKKQLFDISKNSNFIELLKNFLDILNKLLLKEVFINVSKKRIINLRKSLIEEIYYYKEIGISMNSFLAFMFSLIT